MGTSLENCSFNFWDIKEYQKTVKRLENAHKLCSDFATMLRERAEIEKTYAANLNRWSAKWNQFLDAGPEYGTVKSGWQALCNESDSMANIHKTIREDLETKIITEVKRWQKENFHKHALPPQHLKEVKQLEQAFELAQKPWAKRYRAVQSTRKEYHLACKSVQSSKIQFQNAKSDSSLSTEQHRKAEEKFAKAEKECGRTKSEYETALKSLDDDNSRYMEEMTKVFEGSQEKEKERIKFFREMLIKAHEVLDLSKNILISQTYSQLRETFISIDEVEDLNYWSQTYGADMQMYCQQFEEYNPDQTALTMKRKTKADSGVVLTRIQQGPTSVTTISGPLAVEHNDLSSSMKRSQTVSYSQANGENVKPQEDKTHKNGKDYDDALNPFAAVDTPKSAKAEGGNPFDEEDSISPSFRAARLHSQPNQDSLEYENLSRVDSRVGVKVRALYDYNSTESDELTLKAGDVFEKLEDQDEQGWCKGRKNGVVGLYPADYATPCE